jgi:hypothetical protein
MRALALLLLALPASADPITKAGDILKNRDAMEGRSVCLVGKPVSVEERFGTVTGKHLFRAKFDDGTGTVIIFNYGHFPKAAVGELIEVCGRYTRSYTSPSGNVYKDQITTSVLLKGKGINAGLVDIVGDRVVPVAAGKAAAQSSRPPPPK